MKKLLTLVIAGGMLSFLACGPSKAELEKKEKAKQDSIRMADSITASNAAAEAKAAADKAAADAAAAAEKAKQDSIAAAAAAPKDKGKGKEKPKAAKVPKTVTAPGGRPGASKK